MQRRWNFLRNNARTSRGGLPFEKIPIPHCKFCYCILNTAVKKRKKKEKNGVFL